MSDKIHDISQDIDRLISIIYDHGIYSKLSEEERKELQRIRMDNFERLIPYLNSK